ncbi:hypothetical protein RTCIAT899_CH16260 [Rhizobium tropici CIAT 899]|nr:hypothetical protein RTCIAT899_CH16260 [Rhizobium tropici CIAT 899]
MLSPNYDLFVKSLLRDLPRGQSASGLGTAPHPSPLPARGERGRSSETLAVTVGRELGLGRKPPLPVKTGRGLG